MSFHKLLILVPVIFLYSTINTQRSTRDLDGYCTNTTTTADHYTTSFMSAFTQHANSTTNKKNVEFLNDKKDEITPDVEALKNEISTEAAVFLNQEEKHIEKVVESVTANKKDSVVFLNEVKPHHGLKESASASTEEKASKGSLIDLFESISA